VEPCPLQQRAPQHGEGKETPQQQQQHRCGEDSGGQDTAIEPVRRANEEGDRRKANEGVEGSAEQYHSLPEPRAECSQLVQSMVLQYQHPNHAEEGKDRCSFPFLQQAPCVGSVCKSG
jgi:hypothetical protein